GGPRLAQRNKFQLFDILLEKLAGDPAEALGRVGNQENVWRTDNLVCLDRQDCLSSIHHLPNALCGRLRAVDYRDVLADDMLDRAAQDRIVRAAEDQGVDAGVEERLEIDPGDLAGDMRV